MTRAQGFARGDLDTSFPLDDKFLALRGSTDAPTYYAAAGVYFHVVAATWREAERKSASRIAPDAVDLIALLVRVGLFDIEECVPKRAYNHSIARALRARRVATDRKTRNRREKLPIVAVATHDSRRPTATNLEIPVQMSRSVPRDTRDRHAMSTDIQSGAERSSTEQDSTDQSGAGPGSTDILDGPLAYFEVTGKYPPPNGELHRWVSKLGNDYGAAEFQEALAAETIVSPVMKDLIGRTEARLAKAADQARKRRQANGLEAAPKRNRTPEQEAEYQAVRKRLQEGGTA